MEKKNVLDFFLWFDNIQIHFDKALISGIIFLYIPFSTAVIFMVSKNNFSFICQYYFKCNAVLIQASGKHRNETLVVFLN